MKYEYKGCKNFFFSFVLGPNFLLNNILRIYSSVVKSAHPNVRYTVEYSTIETSVDFLRNVSFLYNKGDAVSGADMM
jgi:hypothetical protein